MRRLLPALTLSATLAVAASAAAQAPPMVLPGDAGAARTTSWLIGVKGEVPVRGGTRIGQGIWRVPRARAREAARLAGRALVFAEPDRPARRAQQKLEDPLSAQSRWREAIVSPTTIPPPVGPSSPLIALIDTPAQLSHPEFAGGTLGSTGNGTPFDSHGTATAAVASAPDNDVGILGVWPGARTLNVAMPAELRCSDSVSGIERAITAGAKVINMSYGAASLCFSEYVALQRATANEIIPVAASGNEGESGNPLQFPGSLPHVVTVAAVGADLKSAAFSGASPAVDLGAPGIGIITAVPPEFDGDGTKDGYDALSGTSFAAPMVAGAVAWVRAARPSLSYDQVVQVVRLGAKDIQDPGWDSATGFGLLNVDSALIREPPPSDPLEPNDDVLWIDGRAFGRADKPIFTGRRTRRLEALLDLFEDPHDLYRVRFPARSRLKFRVVPGYGDPDLRVLYPSATTLTQRSGIIDTSARRGARRTESLVIRNSSRRARTAYVHVYIDRRAKALDAGYTLTVSRARR